ncbi:MAG: TonB-dependent receptor plug domain-containing protein, partial [Flavobacteriales bacterium]
MASFSEYKFTFEAEQEDFKFALNSGIRDLGGKTQLTYYPGVDHEITTGIDYVFHRFSPGTLSASSGSTEFDVGSEELNYSHETAWYLQDQFDLGEKIRINAGIRAVYYAQVGPFKRYIPADNDNFAQPEEPTEVNYSKGDIVTDYFGLEPRFNIRYKLNERSSIKAGYTHNYQFVHLASLSPTSLPTDVWIPSSELVRPQFGKQGSIGYFIDFRDGKYEGSVETYYKDLKNLVEYKDGVQPEDNVANNVDNNLTFGDGQSYGVEFFLKKKTGNLNGWVGYTWSKTNRTFEDINEGRTFNAKFDRRHDLSVVGNYKLNEKLTFGASFVYATGNSITLPASIYVVENNVLFEYGDRNSFRMDAYHRVDI